jgi:hypothetical protein
MKTATIAVGVMMMMATRMMMMTIPTMTMMMMCPDLEVDAAHGEGGAGDALLATLRLALPSGHTAEQMGSPTGTCGRIMIMMMMMTTISFTREPTTLTLGRRRRVSVCSVPCAPRGRGAGSRSP